MLASRIVCIFMIFSCVGWIYESIFCTITQGRWENRGFLYGPICPIYGAGAVAVSLLLGLTEQKGLTPAWWQVFLISMLGSAVLEFLTSWVLEKLFHALWWDYSTWPLNLQGRISLFTSLGFGGAGLLIWYILAPLAERLLAPVPGLLLETVSLLLMAIFAADLTLTVNTLKHFDRLVTSATDAFNRNMDAAVESTRQRAARIRDGWHTGQKAVADRLALMSRPAQAAIRRVRGFRYRDAAKETADTVLRVLKRHGRKD